MIDWLVNGFLCACIALALGLVVGELIAQISN
jgi:hypothetical protein